MVPIGKVRTEMVKRISLELVEKYPKSFDTEFEQNKQFLKEIGLDASKKLRNRIAGYITRIIKIQQSSATRGVSEQIETESISSESL